MASAKPFEVSLELTLDCNYSCPFCFTKNFLRKKRPPNVKHLMQVIEAIASEGIERVRFTGGEPLLREDTLQLIRFANRHGLFTSLNTNASLLSDTMAKRLSKCLDDALVSLHAFNKKGEAALSKKSGLFENKVRAIRELARCGVFVRAATVLSKQNIHELENFHSLVESLPLSQWVLLRPIPTPAEPLPISRREIAIAIEKILEFNEGRKKSERFLIENALPFCCYYAEKVSKVALGGLREDGHSSLFIDSYLEIKPSYFLELSLGSALHDSITRAWNSPFMKRMRSLEFIAEPCHECRYVRQCMGGSRFAALLVNGSIYSLDPLALPEKFIQQNARNSKT